MTIQQVIQMEADAARQRIIDRHKTGIPPVPVRSFIEYEVWICLDWPSGNEMFWRKELFNYPNYNNALAYIKEQHPNIAAEHYAIVEVNINRKVVKQ